MSRHAVKALDYTPEEGQLARALLDQDASILDEAVVDTYTFAGSTFLPLDDMDPSTIVDERDFGVRYVSGFTVRPHPVLTRFRPGHLTAAIGARLVPGCTQPYEPALLPVARWNSPLSRIIREVGRLADGWAGENSRAPTDEIVRAMQTLAGLLPAGATEPSAEIDPDDGTVALTWTSANKDESFTTTIFNSGRVGGAHAAIGKSAMRAWIVPVQDYRKLSAHLNQPGLLAIICG